MEASQVAQIHRAIGNITRVEIIKHLASRSYTVNELVNQLDRAQSTVSRHLAVLLACGIVEVLPRGQHRTYSLEPDVLRRSSCWLGLRNAEQTD